MGCFITAYARDKIIRTSQKIVDYSLKKYGKNLYVYSDTDSCHSLLSEDELKTFLDIDPVRLGALKCEGKFTRARFIRQKTYIEEIDNKLKITCASMPSSCYGQVTWDNFHTGLQCSNKLSFKHVKGGVLLVDIGFTLKEETVINTIKKFDENNIYII